MKGWILACALLAGCGGSDADVAGNYTVALTNGPNACSFGNWQLGAMTSGVPIVITQEGSAVTLTVNGVAAVYLAGLLGADHNVYDGGIAGEQFTVTSTGTRSNTMGNCTYTYNSDITGTLDGDVIRGQIEYKAADNGNSDCTAMHIHGCVSSQDYNGTRPPT